MHPTSTIIDLSNVVMLYIKSGIIPHKISMILKHNILSVTVESFLFSAIRIAIFLSGLSFPSTPKIWLSKRTYLPAEVGRNSRHVEVSRARRSGAKVAWECHSGFQLAQAGASTGWQSVWPIWQERKPKCGKGWLPHCWARMQVMDEGC